MKLIRNAKIIWYSLIVVKRRLETCLDSFERIQSPVLFDPTVSQCVKSFEHPERHVYLLVFLDCIPDPDHYLLDLLQFLLDLRVLPKHSLRFLPHQILIKQCRVLWDLQFLPQVVCDDLPYAQVVHVYEVLQLLLIHRFLFGISLTIVRSQLVPEGKHCLLENQ